MAWEKLETPKALGGWGIKNAYWVAKKLVMKSLWRGSTNYSLWGVIIRIKYINIISMIQWLRKENKKSSVDCS